MKLRKIVLSGVNESIVAMGLPHSISGNPKYNIDTARKLARAKSGSGHDCFLKGITVSMDITASQVWWQQFQRYHFADIVSSQSKMHNLMDFDIGGMMCNAYVSRDTIDNLQKLIDEYHKTDDESLKHTLWLGVLYNLPMGMELRARVVTNFLQLKTILQQRSTHKLDEWRKFCNEVSKFDEYNLITDEK